ncbi:NACHT domain-containing protein [Actinoplanes sp. NPDC004185]
MIPGSSPPTSGDATRKGARTVVSTLAAGLVPVVSGVIVNGLSEDKGSGPFALIMRFPLFFLILFIGGTCVPLVLRRDARPAAKAELPPTGTGMPDMKELGRIRDHLIGAMRRQLGDRAPAAHSSIPWIDVRLSLLTDAGRPRTIDGLQRLLRDAGRRVLLTGAPGAGKSEQLRLLAELLLRRYGTKGLRRRRKVPADPPAYLPLLLALPSWTEGDTSFASWAAGTVAQRYDLSLDEARCWLDNGTYCLLLDGLDEVTATARPALIRALATFRPERARLGIVVAHRAVPHQREELHPPSGWQTVRIEPLTPEQVGRYAEAHADRLGELWHALRSNSDLVQLVDSPLFMVLAAEGPPVRPGEKAGHRGLIDAFVGAALNGRSDPAEALTARRRLEGLRRIALFMQQTRAVGFCPDRLNADGVLRRWQRLLCLWVLPVVLAAVVCLIAVMLVRSAIAVGRGMSFGLDVGQSAAAAIGTDVGVVLALAVLVRLMGVTPPAGDLVWRIAMLRKRLLLIGSCAVLVSVAVGVAGAALSTGSSGAAAGWQAGLVQGAVTLGITIIAFTLLGGLETQAGESVRAPFGGLHQSIATASIASGVLGIAAMLFGALAFGPASGVLIGVATRPGLVALSADAFGMPYAMSIGLGSFVTEIVLFGVLASLIALRPADRTSLLKTSTAVLLFGTGGLVLAQLSDVRPGHQSFALPLGPAGGLLEPMAFGPPGGLVGALLGALAVGLAGGAAGWMTNGGAYLLQNRVTLLLLQVEGKVPVGLAAFLDDVEQTGLLVRAGDCYQFRHQVFLEHFADGARR